MIDKDRTNTDVYESEIDTGHKDIEGVSEERPKPIIFKRYYEPRFVAMKLIKRKQYQMRRV